MGVYSKIVSVLRQIDTAHTFIGGTKADITSAWVFVNGERQQVFPSSEVYTQIYAKTDAGAYSQALPYGRYKIVISGAGGSGCAASRNSTSRVWFDIRENGFAGEEKTIMLDVPFGETKTVSGIIGQGGTPSYARADDSHDSATAGTGGTGFANGGNGSAFHFRAMTEQSKWTSVAMASGAGGGASSIDVDGVELACLPGGNGGSCKCYAIGTGSHTRTGGQGGIGGSANNGAAGGAYGYKYAGAVYSTAGTDGYIRIYQSSIYPN